MKNCGILQFANCRMNYEIVFHIADMKNSKIIHFSFFILHFNGFPQIREARFSVGAGLGVMGLAMHI